MILVTLGTQDKSFERLLREVEKLIDKKIIREEVIVQAGYTKYSTDKMKILASLPNDEFEKLISSCSVLITHGGVGSIFDGLSHGKKIIAVPRLSKYKEHANDHQIQVVTELGKEGYLLSCLEVKDLEKTWKKLDRFHPKKYIPNRENMIAIVENYIDQEQGKIGNRQLRFAGVSCVFQLLFLLLFLFTQRFSIPWIGSYFLGYLVSLVITLSCFSFFTKTSFSSFRRLSLFVASSFAVQFFSYSLLSFLSFPWQWFFSFFVSFLISYLWFFLFWGNFNFVKKRAK